MKIILIVGAHKTGTTFIQKQLELNQMFLKSKNICYIPEYVDFDSNLKVKSIDEKPKNPKSNYAVVGLYFLKNDVINIAKECKPSDRGELEITSINNKYLDEGRLNIKILDSIFWLDTGTHDALVEASNFIKTVENREGKRVSCLEEIAYKYKYINKKQLEKIINNSSDQDAYYLKQLIV